MLEESNVAAHSLKCVDEVWVTAALEHRGGRQSMLSVEAKRISDQFLTEVYWMQQLHRFGWTATL
jgi:hypothetical protein